MKKRVDILNSAGLRVKYTGFYVDKNNFIRATRTASKKKSKKNKNMKYEKRN